MQHSRAYSYDDENGGYSGSQIPPNQDPFPSSAPQYRGYQPQGSGQYYDQSPVSAGGTQPDPYLRSITPMVSQSHRYSSSTSGQQRYYPSSGGTIPSSSHISPQTYTAQSPYYAGQYPREHRPHHTRLHPTEGQFIPTPSEIYNNYPPRQMSVPPQSPTSGPYSNSRYPPIVPSSRSPELRSQRISIGQPQTSSSAGSPGTASSPSTERFPCERCGKTFSRSHDRKRHHETQHLATPVIHRCRYCEKEFSRADSLKRHLDNGCDEMPS